MDQAVRATPIRHRQLDPGDGMDRGFAPSLEDLAQPIQDQAPAIVRALLVQA